MTRTARSARKELRALFERALAKETGVAEDVARRVVNRMLRQSDRIAEISLGLCAGETAQQPVVVQAAVPAVVNAAVPSDPPPLADQAFDHVFDQAFDPYAIGAVVTLQRLGPAGLLDRLSAITSVEHLVSLARAQNLSLRTGWSTADELRAAIVSCAEQRLAERRAAAS